MCTVAVCFYPSAHMHSSFQTCESKIILRRSFFLYQIPVLSLLCSLSEYRSNLHTSGLFAPLSMDNIIIDTIRSI